MARPIQQSFPIRGVSKGAARAWASRRRVATVVLALVAGTLAYHVVFGHNGLIVYKQKRDEARSLELQLEALRSENADLKEHTNRLQNDPDAIEHQARQELHYTRPGEVIVTLPPQPAHPSAAPSLAR